EKRITQLGMDNSNAKYLPVPSVLIALNGQGKTRGTVAILKTNATCNQSLVSISPVSIGELEIEFLYFILRNMYSYIRDLTGDNQRSGLSMTIIKEIEIPVPKIEIQKQVVDKLKEEQKAIDICLTLIASQENAIRVLISNVWDLKQNNHVFD
ncbi:MAG: restriction endonuclease subunit S, partial [Pelolinea sp.]|nr:restriction endonuclease subunit S [Pelolinea sp.]